MRRLTFSSWCGLFALVPLATGPVHLQRAPMVQQPEVRKDPKPTQQKDVLAEATHYGKLVGTVYEAESWKPIKNARVTVLDSGQFADKGRTTTVTVESGKYQVDALLGRISHNVDVGRLLTTSLLGLLAGGATNTTKRIDATRFVMRVSAAGYKTFEGVAIARRLDPKEFRVEMEPIILVPERSSFVSCQATGWGYVGFESVKAEPPIVAPKQKVKLLAVVRAYAGAKAADLEVGVTSRFWKGVKKLALKAVDARGRALFEGEFAIGSRDPARVERMTFSILRCLYDVAETGATADCFVQVAPDGPTQEIASIRKRGLDALMSGDLSAARREFASIANTAKPLASDYWRLGMLYATSSEFDQSIQSFEAGLGLAPAAEKPLFLEAYASTLIEAKKYADVVRTIKPLVDATPAKQRYSTTPPAVLGAVGLALVKEGRIDAAQTLNTEMAKASVSGLTLNELVIEFRKALRMAQVEAALKSSPDDARAWADLGRTLLDTGRYAEAVAPLRRSLELDPTSRAVQRDLYYAVNSAVGGRESSPVSFEQALEAARSQAMPDPKTKSKDFQTWHRYAILSLRAASQAPPDERDGRLADTLLALRESLKVARSGATQDSGAYYWYGSWVPLTASEVRIAGFAYREAVSDQVLLEGINAIKARTDDPYGNLFIATALVDLKLYDLATPIVNRLKEQLPSSQDVLLLEAQLLGGLDQPEGARKILEDIIDQNPFHSSANLMLAEIYTKLGDPAAAAARLAEHAKWYGTPLYSEQR